MITTVCMNPSVDRTATVDGVTLGGYNLLENDRSDIGGKGINVAVVLHRLQVECTCVGCLGEKNEQAFMDMVNSEGLRFTYLALAGKTRTNLKVFDRKTHAVTEFNEPGLSMDGQQQEAFLALLKREAAGSQYVVLSGRLPQGCAEDTYQRLMAALPGIPCILDSTGNSLLLGLKEHPFLIKPNLPELEAVIGCELKTLRTIRDAALSLIKQGAQNVIVSMGKFGALLTDGKRTLFAPALQVTAQSTVGAGDAMIGGVMMGLSRGEEMEACFRYGMAAGAASVMTSGTQSIRVDDFASLLPKVTLQTI